MPIWKAIYATLQAAGLTVHRPGGHTGPCTAPFVVPRIATTMPGIGTNRVGQTVVEVYAFVPLAQYTQLEPLLQRVRDALLALPTLRRTGYTSPSVIEDDYQAHGAMIEYIVQRRL